jgi:hypothetical protein
LRIPSLLLGDVLDSPIGAVFPPSSDKCIAAEGQGRKGGHYIRQGHAVPIEVVGGPVVPEPHKFAYKNMNGEKIVLMLRDPRDICVSGAHHWGRDLTTYIHHVGQGTWPMTHGSGLVPWVQSWLNLGIHDCLVRYETLLADTKGELLRILEATGVAPAVDICETVERQSFARRKEWTKQHGQDLNYGKDFQVRFLRKGIAGDWKNAMNPEQVALCDHYFGDMMRQLGYA